MASPIVSGDSHEQPERAANLEQYKSRARSRSCGRGFIIVTIHIRKIFNTILYFIRESEKHCRNVDIQMNVSLFGLWRTLTSTAYSF